MTEFAVFHIEGGIGKHVASTAVIKAYKNNNKEVKVVVVCAYPEVFYNNPNIYRIYKHGMCPYFYQDYIKDKKTVVFAQEPYKTTTHLTKKSHLIESWCDMIGVEYDGEIPEIHFNFRERELPNKLIENPSGKPVLLFQPFGGPGRHHQQHPYSWTRDIHPSVAQKIVNILSEKYHIVHVCYDFHPVLNNCQRIDQQIDKKILFSLLANVDKRLLIDSSLQHAAAAMGLKSTVVWVATEPQLFGYILHDNIDPKVKFSDGAIDSYLFDYNFTGSIHECPYKNFEDIFDIDAILQSV